MSCFAKKLQHETVFDTDLLHKVFIIFRGFLYKVSGRKSKLSKKHDYFLASFALFWVMKLCKGRQNILTFAKSNHSTLFFFSNSLEFVSYHERKDTENWLFIKRVPIRNLSLFFIIAKFTHFSNVIIFKYKKLTHWIIIIILLRYINRIKMQMFTINRNRNTHTHNIWLYH